MSIDLTHTIKKIQSHRYAIVSEMEAKINKIKEEYTGILQKIDAALEILTEMNNACLNCSGRGFYKKIDASGNWDRVECEDCGGTGRAK
ncbi:MAG: hypothetical protein AB1330_01010 [Bacillota bacterium]